MTNHFLSTRFRGASQMVNVHLFCTILMVMDSGILLEVADTLAINSETLKIGGKFQIYKETTIISTCATRTTTCSVDVTVDFFSSEMFFIVEDLDGKNRLLSGSGYRSFESRSRATCIAPSDLCIRVVFEDHSW